MFNPASDSHFSKLDVTSSNLVARSELPARSNQPECPTLGENRIAC